MPGFLHHGIAGVVVGQREDETAGVDHVAEVLGVRHGGRHGLVADDVDPGREKRLRDGVVKVVGGDDRNRFDAVVLVEGGLRLGHFQVGAVCAPRVEPERTPLVARPFGP